MAVWDEDDDENVRNQMTSTSRETMVQSNQNSSYVLAISWCVQLTAGLMMQDVVVRKLLLSWPTLQYPYGKFDLEGSGVLNMCLECLTPLSIKPLLCTSLWKPPLCVYRFIHRYSYWSRKLEFSNIADNIPCWRFNVVNCPYRKCFADYLNIARWCMKQVTHSLVPLIKAYKT